MQSKYFVYFLDIDVGLSNTLGIEAARRPRKNSISGIWFIGLKHYLHTKKNLRSDLKAGVRSYLPRVSDFYFSSRKLTALNHYWSGFRQLQRWAPWDGSSGLLITLAMFKKNLCAWKQAFRSAKAKIQLRRKLPRFPCFSIKIKRLRLKLWPSSSYLYCFKFTFLYKLPRTEN